MSVRRKYVRDAYVRDRDGNVIKILQPADSVRVTDAIGQLHPVVTVVIPAYGRPELVRMAAASVRETLQWNCAEVVVVDDASPAPIGDVGPGVRVIRSEVNLGFGRACDLGAQGARGRFILFLNSDARLKRGCVEEMLQQAHRGYDVVGARLVSPGGATLSAGHAWSDEKQGHIEFGRGMKGRMVQIDRDCEVVSGACMLVRTSTFKDVGGFGGDYGRGYFEDFDLCSRVRERGGRVRYAGAAVCEHLEHQSFSELGDRNDEAIGRGHQVYLDRWVRNGRRAQLNASQRRLPLVSVIVPVHNAHAQVRACLDAALADPGYPAVEWIVVDDASDERTAAMLREYLGERVVRLDKNVGYMRALLEGIARARGDWICSLNSDTVPCRGWLGMLMQVGMSDEKIAVVNPLSNNAANLSVPIPRGADLAAAARMAAAGDGAPVDVVYPVGYCILYRRTAVESLGWFDLKTFPQGYGEETDLCERLLQAGWRCVAAPAAYVYHQGKASHGQTGVKREAEAVEKFKAKHGQVAHARMAGFQGNDAYARAAAVMHVAAPADNRPSVMFYTHEPNLCGGVLACYHLAWRLSSHHGWRAGVATKGLVQHDLMEHVGRLSPLHYPSAEAFVSNFAYDRQGPRGGYLVATAWFTARLVADIARGAPGVKPIYFVQDDEARFFLPDGTLTMGAKPEDIHATYKLIERRVANSLWVQAHVQSHGCPAEVIPVGVDPDLFHPRERFDRPTVLAMCRVTTPRRGYPALVAAAREVRRRVPGVRFLVYGQMPESDDRLLLEWAGQMRQHELADLMGRCHALIEPSEFQGFGLPGLEAMACGTPLVSTNNGGIDTYGVHGENCLIEGKGASLADLTEQVLKDDGLWRKLSAAGVDTAKRFSWAVAAERWDRWLRG